MQKSGSAEWIYAPARMRKPKWGEPLLGFIPGTNQMLITLPAAIVGSGVTAAIIGALSLRTGGAFGKLELRLENEALKSNPKSSEMTALSLVRLIENSVAPLVR